MPFTFENLQVTCDTAFQLKKNVFIFCRFGKGKKVAAAGFRPGGPFHQPYGLGFHLNVRDTEREKTLYSAAADLHLVYPLFYYTTSEPGNKKKASQNNLLLSQSHAPNPGEPCRRAATLNTFSLHFRQRESWRPKGDGLPPKFRSARVKRLSNNERQSLYYQSTAAAKAKMSFDSIFSQVTGY